MRTDNLERLVDRAAAAVVDGERMRDRYRATLLGVAIGNALGLPVEGASRASIRRHWPDALKEISPQEIERPWDDDLAQTVVVAEALFDGSDIDPDDLGSRLLRWSKENGRGIGQLMSLVMSELADGKSAIEAARSAWERSGWSTAGNGAIARCSPVALRWRTSGSPLIRNARTSALVTHYDPRCEWSTTVLATGLAIALSGDTLDLEAVKGALEGDVDQGWAAAGLKQVLEAVTQVPQDLDDLKLDDPMDMGYTLKAMQMGLWCLRQDLDDFESILIRVVNAGGDTDTNGAIAGAVMGARTSPERLPERWVNHIPNVERLREAADRLYDLAHRPTGSD